MGKWKSRGGKSQRRERCGATWRDEIWKIARRCGAKQLLSQNVKNTSCSEHFWKWTCSNSACGCGTKHISKRKCEKHRNFAALLHVKMSKKCTPFVARSKFRSQNVKSTPRSDHFRTFNCATLHNNNKYYYHYYYFYYYYSYSFYYYCYYYCYCYYYYDYYYYDYPYLLTTNY